MFKNITVEVLPELVRVGLSKLYVLLFLQEGPKHGYELLKRLSAISGKKTSASQVYPLLKKLKEKKLVVAKAVGKRGKKVYALTSRGREVLANSLSKAGLLVEASLKRKLKKCPRCGCEVYSGGFEKTAGGKKLVFCCKSCAGRAHG